jgi:hypothetical protein
LRGPAKEAQASKNFILPIHGNPTVAATELAFRQFHQCDTK